MAWLHVASDSPRSSTFMMAAGKSLFFFLPSCRKCDLFNTQVLRVLPGSDPSGLCSCPAGSPDLISLPCITCVSLAPPPPLCVSVAFRLLQSSHSPSWVGSCVGFRAFLVRCGWLLCLRGFLWLACDSRCVQVTSGFQFGSVSGRKRENSDGFTCI